MCECVSVCVCAESLGAVLILCAHSFSAYLRFFQERGGGRQTEEDRRKKGSTFGGRKCSPAEWKVFKHVKVKRGSLRRKGILGASATKERGDK